MAATTQNQGQNANVIEFPKPVQGTGAFKGRKRLPDLTSADIDTMFDHADQQDQNTKIAA